MQNKFIKPLIPLDSLHLYEELPPEDGTKYKMILKEGIGDQVVSKDSIVKIRYMSFFNDPPYTMFDYSHKTMDFFEFKLGDRCVLPVWEDLILTMKRFEKAMLVVSSIHGFGVEGIDKVVPPNMDIKFIIEVIDFIENDTKSIDDRISEVPDILYKSKELISEKKYIEASQLLSRAHEIYLNPWGYELDIENHMESCLEVYTMLSRCLYESKKIDACIFICMEALDYFKNDISISKILVSAYITKGEFNKAKSILNKLIEENGKNNDLVLQLGEIQTKEAEVNMKENLLYRKMFKSVI